MQTLIQGPRDELVTCGLCEILEVVDLGAEVVAHDLLELVPVVGVNVLLVVQMYLLEVVLVVV